MRKNNRRIGRRCFVSILEVWGDLNFLREVTQINYTQGEVVLKVDTDKTYKRAQVHGEVDRLIFRLLIRRIEKLTNTRWHCWHNSNGGEYKMYGPKEDRPELVA